MIVIKKKDRKQKTLSQCNNTLSRLYISYYNNIINNDIPKNKRKRSHYNKDLKIYR